MNCLCILEINPLSVDLSANIFSHSEGCLFILFTVSFAVQKLFYLFILINLFIYLFLGVLGLRFCVRAFSHCGERGPLFIAVHGPLTVAASLVAEHRLQTCRLTGLVAPRHVGSSQTRAQTRVSCNGRQIVNRCATREAPAKAFKFH